MRRLPRRGSGCSRCRPRTRGRAPGVGRTGRQTRRGAPSRSFFGRRHASQPPLVLFLAAREPAPPPPKYYCAGPAERHFRRGSARFKDPAPPTEIPGEMVVAPPAPVERPLWLTVPGASAAVLLAWVGWLVLAALAPALVAASLGPAGAMLAVVTLGWWLARRAPEPGEALRRYHLDEAEVLAVALVVVLMERAVAGFRRRASSVTLDRGGVRVGRVVVPWSDAEVRQAEGGLQVEARGGACVLVATRIANFWAAVPVIETKAQLGPYSATVRFRVRRGDRGLALVGEVEPTA